ncbi:hypothetical protein [Paenibacillus sp. R14(2021)]|uniref:hypothetical protein n=1 Tax=Paenibacillus sp. R14(2021) TaxID=2859228 RepID=UPI001C613FA7|nr:hypothetical protein [Paenibacillus sp. R14(2021)]
MIDKQADILPFAGNAYVRQIAHHNGIGLVLSELALQMVFRCGRIGIGLIRLELGNGVRAFAYCCSG